MNALNKIIWEKRKESWLKKTFLINEKAYAWMSKKSYGKKYFDLI